MSEDHAARHERFIRVREAAGINGMATSGGEESFCLHIAGEDADTLMDKLERLAQLEAGLAERDAALAAAHEALHKIGRVARSAGIGATVELALDAALSAPTLQRAVEELRLLREFERERLEEEEDSGPAWRALRRFREEQGRKEEG